MIPPKHFDMFPSDWGMLGKSPDAFGFFFKRQLYYYCIIVTIQSSTELKQENSSSFFPLFYKYEYEHWSGILFDCVQYNTKNTVECKTVITYTRYLVLRTFSR